MNGGENLHRPTKEDSILYSKAQISSFKAFWITFHQLDHLGIIVSVYRFLRARMWGFIENQKEYKNND